MIKFVFMLVMSATLINAKMHPISTRRFIAAISPRVTARETNTCEEREVAGMICESCDLLSICVKHSNGWLSIPVEACDTQSGFYCNSQLGMCSKKTGPCHPFSFQDNFPCTSAGVFPDPYDCQKYHMCYVYEGTYISAPVECGGDRAFNAATGQCTLQITNSVCTQSQFQCEKVGQAAPWPNNPSIFYICKATSNDDDRVLYPALYRCSDGQVFNGYSCVNGNIPSTTSSPSVTSTTRIPNACDAYGLYPDPSDCRKYLYCRGPNSTLKQLECPLGTYFEPEYSTCVLGTCIKY